MKLLLSLEVIVFVVIHISTVNSAILTCRLPVSPCTVASITPLTSAGETITIAGQPTTYTDSATTSLNFGPPIQVNYVPSDVFRIFPKLSAIAMTNVSISSLQSNAFKNCGNLQSISVSENNFEELPALIAPTCINVTYLYLQHNGIKTIDTDALEGLTFLNSFSLAYNNLTCIPPDLFRHTPVISAIDFSHNHISEIAVSTFASLANLNMISLLENRIVNLPALDFTNAGLTSSLNLILNSNPLNSIDPTFITKLFTTRIGSMSSAYVSFFKSETVASCLPNNSFYSQISGWNWPIANLTYDNCYGNWRSEFANEDVSCAQPETTAEASSESKPSVGENLPLAGNKSLFAIVTNAEKNFTANILFY